jgi:N-methylhydantoinase B
MSSESVDAVTIEVVGNALMACAEEMGAALVRTAYSSNIKERADCSSAIFDNLGQLVVQAEHIPVHLGSLLGIVEHITRRSPPGSMQPGDVFVANDPFTGGGTHLPDIALAQPVFFGDQLVAYVANIAHHSDVGGIVPGSNAGDTRSIFQEGLRIPPVKLVKAGALQSDVLDIILLNSRLPVERTGDLKAQLAANSIGEERMKRLYDRYGAERMQACIQGLFQYAERRIRTRIGQLPPGEYRFVDYLDNDGVGSESIPIQVTVNVNQDAVHLDFTGSGPEAAGAINVPETALKATVFYALKAILDPSVPSNAGFQRAISISAPPHTIVNAQSPAPVSARSETCQRVADVIFGALAQAIPERVVAGCNSTLNGITISGVDPRSGHYYVYPETIGGGMGARPHKDGLDGVHVHITNSSNLPIEALESEYPLRVERYELIQDSCGSGRYRGGMGMRRDIRILGHEAEFALHADRQKIAPWGLRGGKSGSTGKVRINPEGPEMLVLKSGKTSNVILKPGDVISVCTPGGGGYGDPQARTLSAIEKDLREEVISAEKAHADYGPILDSNKQ